DRHHRQGARHPADAITAPGPRVPRNKRSALRHRGCPLLPRKRTNSTHLCMSALCRLCCKSPKLHGDKFPAVRRSDRRPPICVVSITLPRSPVSLSSGDEVPHIFTRKSRLQPGGIVITSAKRLLQQYLPCVDGSELARLFFTFAGWSVQPCVRPVCAV